VRSSGRPKSTTGLAASWAIATKSFFCQDGMPGAADGSMLSATALSKHPREPIGWAIPAARALQRIRRR
jgi:hypothetical protein